VLSPYFSPILWAAILAVIFHPLKTIARIRMKKPMFNPLKRMEKPHGKRPLIILIAACAASERGYAQHTRQSGLSGDVYHEVFPCVLKD
jgi:hypothetical protein